MTLNRHQPYKIGILLFFAVILFALPRLSQAATTTYADVYQITDLTVRGVDIILRKSKGVNQAAIPKWAEKQMGPFQVYQLQVACLDEIRRMETAFKMTPHPHIIASPSPLNEKHLYKLSTILLAEIRRIAIHLNIWGLPKQQRSFSEKTVHDVCTETVALYLKLRALGGRKTISVKEVSGQFGRAVADLKILLNHIDPARRYQDTFPQINQQEISQNYSSCRNIRQELNGVRTLYKLPPLPVPPATKQPSITQLFIQSQIILGELNQIKTVNNIPDPSPTIISQTTLSICDQINTLHGLIKQIKPLISMHKQGGK